MARPLSFNPETKLHEAMLFFWQNGYAETSISELSTELGLNKFSLYKQLGNKETLYRRSLEHYEISTYQHLLKPLRRMEGKASIMAYLDNLGYQLSKPESAYGCFINNTLLAGSDLPESCRNAAKKMLAELRRLLKLNFDRAVEQGQLETKPLECVNFTLMTIQALLNTRKLVGPVVMQGNLKFFKQQITHW